MAAPDGTAVIFVEIYYRYAPLVLGIFDIGRFTQLSSVASMIVRDSRDLSRVDPVPGVTASTC